MLILKVANVFLSRRRKFPFSHCLKLWFVEEEEEGGGGGKWKKKEEEDENGRRRRRRRKMEEEEDKEVIKMVKKAMWIKDLEKLNIKRGAGRMVSRGN